MKKQLLFFIGISLLLAACTAVSGSQNEVAAPSIEQDVAAVTAEESSGGATTNERFPASKYDEYELVTLLPPDAIRSIDNPKFMSAEEADGIYAADELIIGVEFDGDARAYSVPLLSSHEIVNDTVGGEKIAVTW